MASKKSIPAKKRMRVQFLKNLAVTNNPKLSAISAGYSAKSASSQASHIINEETERLDIAFNRLGATHSAVAEMILKQIESGSGVKATSDTALRGIEIMAKLRGWTSDKSDTTTNNTLIIGELRTMPDDQLQARLQSLQRLTAIDNSKE